MGLLRFLLDYQRVERQILMESHGISISTGEISNISREFLLRFYCIYKLHMMDQDIDEYVLHLDGTGESDENVHMAKDCVTGITMDAINMPSERDEYATPFLKRIKKAFQYPDAVMKDMAPAIRNSVAEVFPSILQIICHYHFVKDLGKELLSSYSELREYMLSTKALALIFSVRVPEKVDGIVYAENLWIAIASKY
ncbi:MAG: hypothetical protein QXU18_13880 [Thermoplasmatales archaeon]